MFWSLHGAASRHEGHGSGVDLSSSCGDQDSSLTQRLADPGSLSVSSCLSFGHCAGIVSELGDRSELGEVESSSISASGVLGSGSGFTVFQGFSFPSREWRSSCQLATNFCPLSRSQCHLGAFF